MCALAGAGKPDRDLGAAGEQFEEVQDLEAAHLAAGVKHALAHYLRVGIALGNDTAAIEEEFSMLWLRGVEERALQTQLAGRLGGGSSWCCNGTDYSKSPLRAVLRAFLGGRVGRGKGALHF